MKILIVGCGKLAKAILSAGLSYPLCEVLQWNPDCQDSNEKSVVVHAGSGRQRNECLEFCSRTKSIFIELSTGPEIKNVQPDFPFILCPNVSFLVLKTLLMIKTCHRYFEEFEISITESHQSAKNTEPGTALAFAETLNFPAEKIISVRDPVIQHIQIGIPEDYLNKHAYHKIQFKDDGDEMTIVTKVLGHKSYVNGVKKIIETVLKNHLENKVYTVLELLSKNLPG